MNNVCLVGRLTRDPELRTTNTGISTSTFSLAVDGRPSANGEPHTDFINIVVWRNQAENVCKYCTKGSMVAVIGRITTRSYDAQDGTKRYVTEVVADNVRFLSSKGNSADNSVNYNMNNAGESSSTPANLEEDPFKDFGSEVVLSDDDLPF
jgi:single-stranded DNA-binding protein